MEFLNPNTILPKTDLKSGDIVVDYASGSGHWSIFAAKYVGKEGKVYAIEDNLEMLKMLQKVAEIRNVHNIEIEEIDFETGKSQTAEKANLVIVSNILYLVKNKEGFAENSASLVAPGGELLLIEWDPAEKDYGPSDGKRISKNDSMKMFEKYGLVLDRELEVGWYHYALIFKRAEMEGEKVEEEDK